MQAKLKQDIVIPKGTMFENIDGSKIRYVKDNYQAIIGVTKDSSGHLVYGVDPDDAELMEGFFEYVE